MAMPEIQRLMMGAMQDPEAMDEIRRLLQKRMGEKRSANYYSGSAAPASYGQMSLTDMVAKASGQETSKNPFSKMREIADADPMDIGGTVSLWDVLREF